MSLTIRMFGEYSMLVDGEPVAIADKPRFLLVLAYLILHHDQSLPRARVAFDMWPDASERQAQSNLRNLLFRLQKSIPKMKQCLQIDQTSIRWRPQIETQVDALAFLNLVNAENDSADLQAQIERHTAAVKIYRGNFLPDMYDEWVLIHQERFRDLYAGALQRLVTLHESRHKYDAARNYAKQLVAHDPLYERNHYQLIRHYMLVRDRAAALHAFHDCEAILQRELGVAPGEEILAQYDQLIAGDSAKSPSVGDSVSTERRPTHLFGVGVAQLAIPMVGRQAEWAQLMRIYQDLPANHPQLALISGVAGIGKTRLAEEFLHWTSLQGITTATAHCYSAQRQTAYAPLIAWLRSDAVRTGLPTLAPVWLNEISRLLPELIERHPELPEPAPMHEAWQRSRLFEALARAMLTAPEPILLLLDDIQWVDTETLEWLQFFFNFAAERQVLVVATQRLEEIAPSHPSVIWQRELTRRGRSVELVLERLPDSDVRQLSEQMLGTPLDEQTSRQIISVTEGNPLFVAEMARARLERGREATAAENAMWTELSNTIQATIIYRLNGLSSKTRKLIDLAAVIGREFTFALLDAVSGEEQSVLVHSLDEAWRKYVVREQGALSYDFSHDLIRVAAYNTMSATQRQMTHRAVAKALTKMADAEGQQPADQLAGQIAAHYEQGLMPVEAVEFYRLAAKQARDRYANGEATAFYRHLLDSRLAAHLTRAERYDIRLELCAIDRIRGDWDGALTGYRTLLTEVIAEEDKGYQAHVQRGIANVVRLQGNYDEALTWLSAASENFDLVGDTAGMARSLWTMGEVYWYRGRYGEAMDALQRQLDLARIHDYPREICDATGTMGIVTWSMGLLDESEQYCRQSVALAREIGNRQAEARALITLGNVYASRKEIVEAVEWYQQTLDVAQQIDDLQCAGWAVANLGIAYCNRREFEAAQVFAEHSVVQAVYMGDWWTASLGMAEVARVYAAQHIWSDANHAFDIAMAMGEKLDIPYLNNCYNQCVHTLLLQGKTADADAVHQKAIHALNRAEGEFAGGEDVGFTASLNTIKLGVALKTMPANVAVQQLEELLDRYAETEQQARIHHTLWSVDSGRQTDRQQAIALCKAHYDQTQELSLFDEYHDLTGQILPSFDPLPAPPGDLLVPLLSLAEAQQAIERWLTA